MELHEYVRVLQKSWVTVVGVTVAFILVTVAVLYFSKPQYDTNVTLTLDRPNTVNQSTVNYYLYDSYYTIQSSGFYADTIINWLGSPGIVQAIYNRAAVPLPPVRVVTQLGKVFTARKFPPATVSITLQNSDNQQGKILLDAATKELQQKSDELTQKNINESIVIHSTDPVTTKVVPFWALDIVIAALIGLLLSTFMVFLQHYMQDEAK